MLHKYSLFRLEKLLSLFRASFKRTRFKLGHLLLLLMLMLFSPGRFELTREIITKAERRKNESSMRCVRILVHNNIGLTEIHVIGSAQVLPIRRGICALASY